MTIRFIIIPFLVFFSTNCSPENKKIISEKDFKEIVKNIAEGWNEGNAAFAVQYFDEEAVYEEPPAVQLYKGRNEIYEFFGGDDGFDIPMKMTWHNLAVNQEKQIGFGEYTFEMNNQYHGIVAIKFKNGKIVKWREYQYKSEQLWEEFAEESIFKTIE